MFMSILQSACAYTSILRLFCLSQKSPLLLLYYYLQQITEMNHKISEIPDFVYVLERDEFRAKSTAYYRFCIVSQKKYKKYFF